MLNKFCLVGNSHLSQFNKNIHTIYGYGASIYGLHNENSVLKLKTKIIEYQILNPDKYIVFFLGQTNIEFIYYYKCITNNYKMPISEFINEIVEKYISFIIKYIHKPIILGINPTVIKSNKHIFNVNFKEQNPNNPNGSHNPDISYEDVEHFYDNFEKRFSNNLNFNIKINMECQKLNIPYIDLNKYILDDNTIKKEYLFDFEDHHLKYNSLLTTYLFNEIAQIIKE